ncbi:hypothetical protein Tco_0421165 [Tanacetum coccineum]
MNNKIIINSKTIKHKFIDDQIDSDIIFDDPYVEDNSRQFEHDQDAHDQNFAALESLIYNVQVEAKNQRIMNNELKSNNLPDFEETLVDMEESRLKMKDKMIQLNYVKLNKLYDSFVPQKEISADQTYLSAPSTSNVTPESSPQKSSLPPKVMPKASQLLKLCQAQSIDFELQLQHQKEINACDISWKSKMEKLNDENVSLAFQVDSFLKERENIKLEYQPLFNSIKMTRAQHQWEVNELIENVNQKTYVYVDVHSKNL